MRMSAGLAPAPANVSAPRFAAAYAAFFRQPDVTALVAVALFARMPIGMIGLGMLMFLREALGSYALAGSVCGLYFVALAIGAPVQGRIIDRSGPKLVLGVTGIVQPLALLAVLLLARAGAAYAAVAAAAACAGLFAMPITVLTRTLWRHRFSSEEDLLRAFAIDAVMIEANYALGPAVVAGVFAAAGATAAFGVSIAVLVGGLVAFVVSPALRYFRVTPHEERHLLGPLTEPRLWIVFAATFGIGVAFGCLEVGYPGYATSLALPALGGVWLSVCSVGSALAGTLFGGARLRSSVERQFAVATGLMVLPLLLHAALSSPLAFGVVAFVAGAAIAPSIACQSVLVSRLAPPRYATEAFTWSSTCIMGGVGAGLAVGGWLIEAHGVKTVFVGGAAVMLGVSALAFGLGRLGRSSSAATALATEADRAPADR